jgi:NAD(P)H-flavin reductase
MARAPVEIAEPPGAADPMAPTLYVLERVRSECHDTFTMELEASDGENVCSFRPGQYNMLYVFGVGEVPISISGDPSAPRRLVHTTRVVGMVTQALKRVRIGESIGVRGPYGNWWPLDQAVGHDVVIIAGGIGLAPLRPVVCHVLANRADFGRFLLLYGTRSPEDILFSKELAKWRAQLDAEIIVTVDRASPQWRGNVGVVTQLIGRAPFDPIDTVAMICGPEIMMRYAAQEVVNRGVDRSKVFLSMERNMKCGVGFCGRCQLRDQFICRDGPVYRYDAIEEFLQVREV